MRITFVLPVPSLGGGTRVVAEYAARLASKGHEVTVVAQPIDGPTWRDRMTAGLKRRKLKTAPRSHLEPEKYKVKYLDVARPVKDSDVPEADIVIATWWETANWVNELSPKKGAKIYFVQHHEVFDFLPQEKSRATYRLPMHKIVVADWLKKVMLEHYDAVNVDVVPNSVDKSLFFANHRTKQRLPTIGFMYATAKFKGGDLATSAISMVQQKIPNLRVLALTTEQPTTELPLPHGAELCFSPPQQNLRSIYSSCDIWLSASRSEGFNLPAMEAMACRTPVVASSTGWPAEAIVSGWNGKLCEVGDAQALADGAVWVLSLGREDWETLSRNALATVENSSWDRSANMFEAVLEKVLSVGA